MLAERLGELGPGTGEPLADRLRLLSEDLGDLRRREALDAHQQGDLAIRRRELCERALEGELRLRVGERLERRACVAGQLARGEIARELRAHGLGAGPAHEQPVRDGEQVRAEARVGLEPLRGLGEPEERLLEEILGDVLPAGHPEEVAVEPPAIGTEHRIERGGLAPAEALDPGALVGLHAQHNARAGPA